jgi:hypothetical protein
MPGLVPGIHALFCDTKGVDGRVKPGHDMERIVVPAKAGTHNHRLLIGLMVRSAARRVSNHGAASILRDASLRDAPQDEADWEHRVWVPAFAGTTAENYRFTDPNTLSTIAGAAPR